MERIRQSVALYEEIIRPLVAESEKPSSRWLACARRDGLPRRKAVIRVVVPFRRRRACRTFWRARSNAELGAAARAVA